MIVNLDAIKRAHQHLMAQTARAIEEEANAAGQVGEDHVRQFATFKRRSGQLQEATTHRVVRLGKNRILRLQNPKKYAAAIDGGARPHKIQARRAKVLAFMPKGGGMVFRRSVNHPGNKPYKFLYRATFAAYRVLGPNLHSAMSRIASKF